MVAGAVWPTAQCGLNMEHCSLLSNTKHDIKLYSLCYTVLLNWWNIGSILVVQNMVHCWHSGLVMVWHHLTCYWCRCYHQMFPHHWLAIIYSSRSSIKGYMQVWLWLVFMKLQSRKREIWKIRIMNPFQWRARLHKTWEWFVLDCAHQSTAQGKTHVPNLSPNPWQIWATAGSQLPPCSS